MTALAQANYEMPIGHHLPLTFGMGIRRSG